MQEVLKFLPFWFMFFSGFAFSFSSIDSALCNLISNVVSVAKDL